MRIVLNISGDMTDDLGEAQETTERILDAIFPTGEFGGVVELDSVQVSVNTEAAILALTHEHMHEKISEVLHSSEKTPFFEVVPAIVTWEGYAYVQLDSGVPLRRYDLCGDRDDDLFEIGWPRPASCSVAFATMYWRRVESTPAKHCPCPCLDHTACAKCCPYRE